jgi:uncharacterized ferritin-like protein (DUF455 family)
MEIADLARAVLLGTTLDEKLVRPDELTDRAPGAAIAVPAFPGRPGALQPPAGRERAPFPRAEQLGPDAERGRLLHFFANHELLAMELMALVLLRFPDAPAAFRAGVARTIGEEQSHMELYLGRMQELGVGFGDIPLSRYFWDAMSGMRSPLEFVVQMSLTFEQANLDFAAHFRDAVARVGDARTAALLERVYREEIGHVKHGVTWFNRWREEGESDWAAYCRLLPAPLSPRRARGLGFQEDARREAGLSEIFVREVALQAGSRGRLRVVWWHNPLCEAEIARGRADGVSASRARVARDLAHLPMFLARDQDVVALERRPRLAWLEELARAGVTPPDFVALEAVQDEQLGGLEPWGWSPEAMRRLAPLAERLVDTPGANAAWARTLFARGWSASGLAPLYSKAWSAAWLAEWLRAHPEHAGVMGNGEDAGVVEREHAGACARVAALLDAGHAAMVKAPLGTAGTQVRRIASRADLEAATTWIAKRVTEQGAVVVEPFFDKTSDLSAQMEIDDGAVRVIGVRRFLTGPQFEYRGTLLGGPQAGFSREELRFLFEARPGGRVFDLFEEIVRAVGASLAQAGYRGPAGVDALIHKTAEGLRLRPVVEVNPRWTMGRVALALEGLTAASGAFWLVPVKRLGPGGAQALTMRHPVELRAVGTVQKIARGLLWTSDPEDARDLLTVLTVGQAAMDEVSSLLS